MSPSSPPSGEIDRAKEYPDEIRAQGKVIEVLRNRAYRVELPNGHQCVGQAEKNIPALGEGTSITIAFHPYDIARGWIVAAS